MPGQKSPVLNAQELGRAVGVTELNEDGHESAGNCCSARTNVNYDKASLISSVTGPPTR